MTQSNYIVAIDMGSSHLVGMIGVKSAKGTLTIIAEEREETASAIRRGCVYNVGETATRLKRLILKLQNKLSYSRIEKIYIGIGGQSLRSIDHSEVRTIHADEVVTEEDLRQLHEQCKSYHPELLDVLAIAPPVYYLDEKRAEKPVGIPCKRIEAKYKLIVGRPSIRRHLINSIEERANINLAGIIVSPLALADAMLTENEKALGCALIDFGAGVTSLTVYKQGHLAHLSVIPLGGDLITRDLTSLQLVESEAERLKITYAGATTEKGQEGPIPLGAKEGVGMREIDLVEINTVVEARIKEIIENVYARLEETGLLHALGAGIILAGGASSLKGLQSVVRERFKLETRFSTIQREFLEEEHEMMGDPQYMTAISLLLKGTENCVSTIAPIQPTEIEEKEEVDKEEKEAPEKKKRIKLKRGIFETIAKGLFDEE